MAKWKIRVLTAVLALVLPMLLLVTVLKVTKVYAQSVAVGLGGFAAKPITALLATAVNVKFNSGVATPGLVGSLLCYNPNASVEYVQVFDVSAAPTVGTTPARFFVPLPASTTTLVSLGVDMFNGMVVAATTTPGGNTAPGTALPCTVLFK